MIAMLAAEVLKDDSPISIGLAVACLGVGVWVASSISGLRKDVVSLKARLGQYVTKSEMSALALREAISNPGHRVPDPENPANMIVVEKAHVDRNL